MTLRRLPLMLAATTLALTACGGGSDTANDSASESDTSGATSAPGGSAEPADASDSNGSDTDDPDGEVAEPAPDEAAEPAPAGLGEPLPLAWSAPVNGNAGGAALAFSPDGSQLAFVTGGLESVLQVHDTSTGELVNSADYHGQGLHLAWSTDNQLVSWDSERFHAVDAATLEYPGATDLTIAPGAEGCPTTVFDVSYDSASNAMFASDFADTGAIVCRLDLGTATMSATVLAGTGGSDLFVRPESDELVVAYASESISALDAVAVLDAATLEVKSSEPSEVTSAATATDRIIAIDRFTDGFASSGQALPAQADGNRFGPYLTGYADGMLVVMDATTGAAVYSGTDGFRPVIGTADGSKIAVLLADAIELYDLG